MFDGPQWYIDFEGETWDTLVAGQPIEVVIFKVTEHKMTLRQVQERRANWMGCEVLIQRVAMHEDLPHGTIWHIQGFVSTHAKMLEEIEYFWGYVYCAEDDDEFCIGPIWPQF